MKKPAHLILLLILFLTNSVYSAQENHDGDFEMVCPTDCSCTTTSKLKFPTVSCTSLNLTSVPEGISPTTKKLDLSGNNITLIGESSLAHLVKLLELNLKSNLIKDMEPSAFANLSDLRELTLSRNQLKHFPADIIQLSSKLELLINTVENVGSLEPVHLNRRLDHNQISRLDRFSFRMRSKLYALHLGNNLIEEIDTEAFSGLTSIHILELNDNRLTEVPVALSRLPNLGELSLANNRILRIDIPFHEIIPKIVLLEIRGNPTQWIHPEGFTHLKHLKKLILSDVKNLTEFPHLNGTSGLEILRIDRCSLHSVPQNLCTFTSKLKSLDLKSNRITTLPDLNACKELRILDLSINLIEDLGEGALERLSSLHDLHISRNKLKTITESTFRGLNHLRTLDMSYNMIANIHPDAFLPVEKLEDLNLGNNFFPELPAMGLEGVLHLKTFNNPNLREFPGPESFPRVRTLVLSYAYHCCQFSSLRISAGHPNSGLGSSFQEDVIYPTDRDFDSVLSTWNLSELWPGLANFSNQGALAEDFLRSFSGNILTTESPFEDGDMDSPRVNHKYTRDIQCIPTPGPFLPCNDLFDWWTLRCGVWIVFLLALMGNGTVVFVLIFARTKMDVPRFLVCNLAIADFCMGVYLGFLAVVDAATLGEFRKFAIPWQLSNACQTAGFLGVLSSELSVYTLAVITMERHYAITHAMHLNKRLSLRHASYIMVLGWSFSILMATLPLFGISDYRKFAVCLPFETGDGLSMSYVVFLMFANGVAFTILMGCYLKMYCSIRGSQAWNSNDTRIAKRMALLVFTDLLCWFPIAFFSLTAVFGLQLVSLEEAKVFTVFILPFNSCCNPFLYAILTKQFKKDCVLICKAIEESRVTRGIGRCRNSSNFSNRQTAPNTGSLVEKSSKDGQPCICHNGLHPGKDMNGNAKYRFMPAPERWSSRYGPLGRFISRYILCQNNSKEANRQARDDYRMRNVRRYLYNTANVNVNGQTDPEKHQRHPSVSSDNFSSSRSDSWRVQGRCGIPLRLLEPRRRNSWAVTRKPSQDSNLSNSRNDSSATSNSTNTWRLSRSSVSSDATNHSGGGKSSLKKTAVLPGTCAITSTTTAIISNVTHTPSTSVANSLQTLTSPNKINELRRPKTLQFLDEGILPALHQQKRNSLTKTDPTAHGTKNSSKVHKDPGPSTEVVTDLIDDDEVSAKIATNRPRLVRQSAFFSDELVIEPEVCPVHGSLIPGTYDDENDDEDGRCPNISDLEEEDEEDEELVDPTSPILRKYSGSSPNSIITGTNGNPYSIALVIVPRRLSTISSRDTTSVQSREDVVQPGPSTSTSANSNGAGPSSIKIPAISPGRRKMSEQPGHLYLLPGNVVSSAKWHSMSSMETNRGDEGDGGESKGENTAEEDSRERRVSFQFQKIRSPSSASSQKASTDAISEQEERT